ncbi:alpha/beta fold hydrolase [Canibacter zhoujuaniae]|uniref:alpha/beta fold hydrolase n=1 Tax=Canibacter zhoujuaniae TaxID=2708343 RepID=UPI0014237F0F|nr:alpha/beta hydrolase [Canibacter zhoujuaniae]
METEVLYVPMAGAGATAAWVTGPDTGVPIVLVHGFRGDHHGLNLIVDGILKTLGSQASEYRIIVPDLPGFGQTPTMNATHDIAGFAAWLQQFCHAVAPAGAHIIAHSFGTLVSAAAVGGGLQPLSLTLINPISAPALEGPRALATKLAIAYYRAGAVLPQKIAHKLLSNGIIVRGMSEIMAKTRDRQLRGWIHRQHSLYFSNFADTNSLLEAFQASVSTTVGEELGATALPIQLIVGEKDDITALPEQLALANKLPKAQIHIVGGVGHLVHYEAPLEAAQLAIKFIQSLK